MRRSRFNDLCVIEGYKSRSISSPIGKEHAIDREIHISVGIFRNSIFEQNITLVSFTRRCQQCPCGIAHVDRAILEFERDIGAGSVDRDDHGVLVGIGIGAVPGFVGGDGGEGLERKVPGIKQDEGVRWQWGDHLR